MHRAALESLLGGEPAVYPIGKRCTRSACLKWRMSDSAERYPKHKA